MFRRFALVVAVLMACLGLQVADAHALDLTMAYEGTVIIGQSGGRAVAVNQGGNNCALHVLSQSGGLAEHTVIRSPANKNMSIFVAFGEHTLCGFTITPLITNGRTLIIDSSGGNDVIWNLSTPRVAIYAGHGNDTVVNLTNDPVFFANGWDGNDTLFGGNNSTMIGGYGDDYFCVLQNQVAAEVNGGAGWDALCGAALTGNIEELRCGCGLF